VSPSFLAAVLDGRVVVLDMHQARVILLDPDTERIWRACTGRPISEIATGVGLSSPEVAGALRDLAAAGLVASDASGWTQVPVTWV
jgi:AraC-like DNA-binding protein